MLLEVFLVEDLAVGDLAHEQFDNDEQFLRVDAEAGRANLRSFSEGLNQRSLRL